MSLPIPSKPPPARMNPSRTVSHLNPLAPPRSIKQLTKLLNEYAPQCIKEQTLHDLNGRRIAFDASMAIYAFLVRRRGAPAAFEVLAFFCAGTAVLECLTKNAPLGPARRAGRQQIPRTNITITHFPPHPPPFPHTPHAQVAVRSTDGTGPATQLMNEAGEVTSHLQGMWYRTLKFLDAGIKPVYVFDGKPPTLKSGELAKRAASKAQAAKDMEEAVEAGNVEDIDRFARRTVHMTSDHVNDCKKLLRLMGMPVVEAPCEAEAQCAALARADKVYAAASEDMDTLTFGAPRLVRKLWASEAAKIPVLEFSLEKALAGLDLTYDQFVDVCILAGCDYCEPIKGECCMGWEEVGGIWGWGLGAQILTRCCPPSSFFFVYHAGIAATTAYKRVKESGSLKDVVEGLDPEKFPVPKGVDYDEVRMDGKEGRGKEGMEDAGRGWGDCPHCG